MKLDTLTAAEMIATPNAKPATIELTIGEFILVMRRRLRMTQKQLAKALQCDADTLARIESNNAPYTRTAWAAALWLQTRTGEVFTPPTKPTR